MATINIPSAPRNLTMQDFRSHSDMFGSLQKSARFAIRMLPQGAQNYLMPYANFMRDFTYLCEVAEFPGRGLTNIDVRYYGPNQKLPFQTQYEDINMTFLCRNKSFERQFFDDWMTIINPVNTYDFNYRDNYSAEIDIYQFSDFGRPSYFYGPLMAPPPDGFFPGLPPRINPIAEYRMTLHDAYPVLVNPQPVTWQDDQFQRVIVNFTYTKWSRKGLDPVARQGAPQGFSFNLVEKRSVTR